LALLSSSSSSSSSFYFPSFVVATAPQEELLLKLNNASNKTGPLKGGGKGQDQAGSSTSLLLIRHHAVEYLEHCVDCLGPQASTLDKHGSSGQAATGNTGRAHTNAKATIFHYLLLLYAKEPDGGASLVKFLDRHLQTEVGSHLLIVVWSFLVSSWSLTLIFRHGRFLSCRRGH